MKKISLYVQPFNKVCFGLLDRDSRSPSLVPIESSCDYNYARNANATVISSWHFLSVLNVLVTLWNNVLFAFSTLSHDQSINQSIMIFSVARIVNYY